LKAFSISTHLIFRQTFFGSEERMTTACVCPIGRKGYLGISALLKTKATLRVKEENTESAVESLSSFNIGLQVG
jgi:hypothetical protein